jgi:decaprenylphospho-beta-D-ribofuranose 2-oxidase
MTVRPDLSPWLIVWLVVLTAGAVSGQSTKGARTSIVNDVSRLNPVEVREVYEVHDVDEIRSVLARAQNEHLKVSIAGKRHSQGQQTAYKGGLVIDMTHFNKILHLDQQTKIITVQSGAT